METNAENAAPEAFELSGGALCLDFANTWGNHGDPGSDRLLDYGRHLAFARQTGYLTDDSAAGLAHTAERDPEATSEVFALFKGLRQVIYRIFSSHAAGRNVPAEDLVRINELIGDALSHRKLERCDGCFVLSWSDVDVSDLRAPLWAIVESAAALLTSGEFDRVRECDADDCNWLFLDNSRSGTRRWCSMSSCGNRAKARRHYHRQRDR